MIEMKTQSEDKKNARKWKTRQNLNHAEEYLLKDEAPMELKPHLIWQPIKNQLKFINTQVHEAVERRDGSSEVKPELDW